MKLIIGLGNPGEKYLNTRHNMGFRVVEEYAKNNLGPEIVWEADKKFKAEILKLPNDLWLVKPQTFMNHSGMAVQALMDYFKIPLEDIVVIYDEMDLPLGKIKVRSGGSAAGHHGVESIIASLSDDKFARIRLGIGNLKTQSAEHTGHHTNVDHFVTEDFAPNEKSKVKHMLKQAVKALELLLDKGLDTAQNQFN